jgi:hypothetical protein
LLLLKKLDFLNRDQLIKLFSLGSVRNANRVLGGMKDYLSSYREGYQSIYYLNKEGREYVDSQKVRKKSNNVEHYIARNDFYIFAGRPVDWKNEIEISDGEIKVICDALYKQNGWGYLLEVDLQQSMNENRNKISSYKTLYDRGLIINEKKPMLYWLTTTELRRKQLTQACEGLPFKVFTQQDIK